MFKLKHINYNLYSDTQLLGRIGTYRYGNYWTSKNNNKSINKYKY